MAAGAANLSTVLLYTAVVIVALACVFPFWWKFDPIVNILDEIGFFKNAFGTNDKLFTKEELSHFGASVSKDKIYLAILGKVFDVTSGMKHYGKDGSYSFFTGIDGTRAFVSGNFDKDGLTDDIHGLKDEECFSLSEWTKFYEKDYDYVGKVIGNFYDKSGVAKEALDEFNTKVKRALKAKANDQKEKDVFPDCNSRWSAEEGTVLWCSNESGGVKRDWIGVPRMFFKAGQSEYRCACVHEKNLHDKRLRQYPDCEAKSVSCKAK